MSNDPTPKADQKDTPKHKNRPRQGGEMSWKTKKALALVINHGVDPKEAYTLANGREPSPANLTGFKQKVEKFSLQAPALQKLAHQVVKDTLKGKVRTYEAQKVCAGIGVVDYIETVSPSHTNQLAAAAMVMDRVDPILKVSLNRNEHVEIPPIDLSNYLNRTTICSVTDDK